MVFTLQDFKSMFGPFYNIMIEKFNFQAGFTSNFQPQHVSVKKLLQNYVTRTKPRSCLSLPITNP